MKEESRQELTARATTITGALNQVIKVAVIALTLLVIPAIYVIWKGRGLGEPSPDEVPLPAGDR